MAMPDAIATLTEAFVAPSTRQGGTSDSARPVAVISSPDVPIEIVRASGLRPVVVRGSAAATPRADERLEPDVFPNRLRQLVEAFLAGHFHDAACIVLPRTSDPDYKAFLYLRELSRQGLAPPGPPVLLFDLLQSNGPDVVAYDAARARALLAALTEAGRPSPVDDLRETMAAANAARAAMRKLLDLRSGAPRVSGVEVLPLLGASWVVAPSEYAALATDAAETLKSRPPIDLPRVLLAGAPVDGPALHAAIEALGAVVVAEPGPWGSDAAGEDVSLEGDPFVAIAGQCRRRVISARTPAATVQQRLRLMASGVEAVVMVLPPDDTAFGWDYPALRTWLEARHLPHVCVTGDPCLPPGAADLERLARLIALVRTQVGARHG